MLRNRINSGNIFPPIYRNPTELLRLYLGLRRRVLKPPSIYDIFKINFTKEAERLGFNDQFLINHEANYSWTYATRQQRQHYNQLTRDVQNLYSQINARNYYSRNSRSYQVVSSARLSTNNVNVTSPTRMSVNIRNNNNLNSLLNDNIFGDTFNDGIAFNSDNEFDMTFLNPWPQSLWGESNFENII
ncbi:hypothetical protein C1645_880497 [Glomus cerebriforme]|uniref:HMG box domain-containing protein n=1 Tax=Glomus cerebriforme TaxID=658196 RepID=A0A397SEZ3_9GLOM|nr:hypothetical protein C1645_880497 [Glomus cerebriforme]